MVYIYIHTHAMIYSVAILSQVCLKQYKEGLAILPILSTADTAYEARTPNDMDMQLPLQPLYP